MEVNLQLNGRPVGLTGAQRILRQVLLLSTIVSNGSKQGGARWSQGGATVTISVLACWLTASNDSDLSFWYTAKQDMYLSNSPNDTNQTIAPQHFALTFNNSLLICPFIGRIYITHPSPLLWDLGSNKICT